MIEENEKYNISHKIRKLREEGNLKQAIQLCSDACNKYSTENIFPKILGDMYFQIQNYDKSFDAYLAFLQRINNNPQLFNNFKTFYERYNSLNLNITELNNKILKFLNENTFSAAMKLNIFNLIKKDNNAVYTDIDKCIDLTRLDKNFNIVLGIIKSWESNDQYALLLYLNIIESQNIISKENTKLCLHISSVMEKYQMYAVALSFTSKLLMHNSNGVAIRRLFRLCRITHNYDMAQEYIKLNNQINKINDFNIQYELVYYYNYLNDIASRNEMLDIIARFNSKSLPILKTVYNFYIQFDMLANAEKIITQISIISNQKNNSQSTEAETDQAIWSIIKNLKDEQTHTQQLIAMKDLIKGFSHELGQPVTNIRYGIQLYNKKLEMGKITNNDAENLLNSILVQTNRLGNLLERFSPIISSKSKIMEFDTYKQIKQIFEELESRLKMDSISYNIICESNFLLSGDILQFSQIFYNLITNAIHAIHKNGDNGIIYVKIYKRNQAAYISFQDNGIGIPNNLYTKIFEPFFTTKDKTIEEGGEGLGLFITWNIIKMFGGIIYVDKKYKKGARFIIKFYNK